MLYHLPFRDWMELDGQVARAMTRRRCGPERRLATARAAASVAGLGFGLFSSRFWRVRDVAKAIPRIEVAMPAISAGTFQPGRRASARRSPEQSTLTIETGSRAFPVDRDPIATFRAHTQQEHVPGAAGFVLTTQENSWQNQNSRTRSHCSSRTIARSRNCSRSSRKRAATAASRSWPSRSASSCRSTRPSRKRFSIRPARARSTRTCSRKPMSSMTAPRC